MKQNLENIIDSVHAQGDTKSRAQAERVVRNVFGEITRSLVDGNRVMVAGFGIFDIKDVSARKGRNPRTGETIEVPARKKVKFTVAKALKDAVQ